MKTRAMTCAFVLLTGLTSAGAALAQSASPTTPPSTPNDATGAQPNRPLPAGQMAPAPNATPSTGTTAPAMQHSGTMSSGKKHSDENAQASARSQRQRAAHAAAGAAPSGVPEHGRFEVRAPKAWLPVRGSHKKKASAGKPSLRAGPLSNC